MGFKMLGAIPVYNNKNDTYLEFGIIEPPLQLNILINNLIS